MAYIFVTLVIFLNLRVIQLAAWRGFPKYTTILEFHAARTRACPVCARIPFQETYFLQCILRSPFSPDSPQAQYRLLLSSRNTIVLSRVLSFGLFSPRSWRLLPTFPNVSLLPEFQPHIPYLPISFARQ